MSKDLTTAYFGITKADKNADGTLMVYGKATDDSLDIDQQICDPVWLDTAMPNWFKTGGNIREQHSQIAAGVAKEYEKKADGHFISVLVVDPVSVKKVDAGVLKGFSIGIKSPRVVRDTKAANGRIIDGQIVEVSLVDRPANPNCQLVLAKSVNGESGVWKVEELIEKSDEVTPEATEVAAEVVAEETVAEAVVEETPIAEIKDEEKLEELGIEKAAKVKSILATLIKFDKTQYEAAREALANLIAVEAEGMKEGHNEIMSISHLLEAVAHLHAWYEGEEAEGEVVEEIIEAEKAPVSDMGEKETDKMCADCKKSYKMCKCEGGFKSEAATDTTPTGKTGANLDGVTNIAAGEVAGVPFQQTVTESQARINAKSTDPEEKVSEATEKVAAEDIEAIVEKAVKSATESIRSEVASLVSAKEAALEKAATLETELATAKSLAIGGGPKRTAKPIDTNATNDLITKALVFKAKANAATDPTLAKGYKALADEFLAKANATDLTK
jgi:hypothetical protein